MDNVAHEPFGKIVGPVCITGCAGFIGSAVARFCEQHYPNLQLMGIDDFSTGRRNAVPKSVVLCEGSITDEAFLARVFAEHKPRAVLHFAAIPRVAYSVEHPIETLEVNVAGTVRLLEAARKHGVERFVFSSSSSIYGDTDQLPTAEDGTLPKPKSPYAAQKLSAEHMVRLYAELYGMNTLNLRYFNVFGPGQYGDSAYATVISAWLHALYGNGDAKPYLEGDGNQSRDFCYVDNVVQANLRALASAEQFHGIAINVACGDRTSLNDIYEIMTRVCAQKFDLEERPPRLGDIIHTQADISRARKLLEYEPAISVENGIEKTVAWYRDDALGQ